MDHRSIGSLRVSVVGLGGNNFGMRIDATASERVVHAALDAGINFFDTADIYGSTKSEEFLGRALAGRRDRAIVATKFGMAVDEQRKGAQPEYVKRACDDSLRRLGIDHIDLYQLHRPSFDVPQEETLAAMDELVTAGKVRFLGASTYPAWKVMEGLAVAREQGLPSYVSEQPPYNLLDRRIENELVPLCQTYDLAILPWSPLAAGILAGRYDSAEVMPEGSRGARVERTRERVTEAGLDVARQLGALARDRGLTTSQLALLWVKDQPGITAPIVGSRTMAQLDDALGILDRTLDDDARAACDELVHPGNAVSDFHNTTGWIKSTLSP